MTLTIGFLGTGRIAEPMIRALSRTHSDAEILISERSKEVSDRLSTLPNVTVVENPVLVARSDVLFLCLLADVARTVLAEYTFHTGQTVISVMADISLQEVGELIAPASDPCVTIPLPFIDSGGCPLPVFPRSQALENLFARENPIITLQSEADIDAHFAASAILQSTMKHLNTASHWLADQCGSSVDGERYVVGLMSGYLGSLLQDGHGRFEEAMQELSTEGGLNTQLRTHIESSGYYQTLHSGLDGLLARLRESNR